MVKNERAVIHSKGQLQLLEAVEQKASPARSSEQLDSEVKTCMPSVYVPFASAILKQGLFLLAKEGISFQHCIARA